MDDDYSDDSFWDVALDVLVYSKDAILLLALMIIMIVCLMAISGNPLPL